MTIDYKMSASSSSSSMTFGLNVETGGRPMNTVADVGIIQKLAHKDIIALFQKCQGDKVRVFCLYVIYNVWVLRS
jgi:hypothetical protein